MSTAYDVWKTSPPDPVLVCAMPYCDSLRDVVAQGASVHGQWYCRRHVVLALHDEALPAIATLSDAYNVVIAPTDEDADAVAMALRSGEPVEVQIVLRFPRYSKEAI